MNPNSFKEVAAQSGIQWSRQKGNEAFSIAWLDYNNDGLMDLWVSGHGYNGSSQQYPDGKFPYLYLNNGNGTFTNLFAKDWRGGVGGDIHGTTWIDFDNDGDRDMFAASGGKLGDANNVNLDLLANKFFVNSGGILEDRAAFQGLENAIARSRSSVWFDGNNDGLLDVVVVTALRDDEQGYTAYFEQQTDGTFSDRTFAVGLDVNESSRYAQLADLTGDGKLDLVIQGTYTSPLAVYDFASGTTFQEVTNLIPQISDAPADPTFDFADHSSARDSILADFNNDGHNDIFMTRSRIFTPEPSIFQGSNTIASADLILQTGGEIGISLKTDGVFAFDSFDFSGRDAIYAGGSGNGTSGFDANNIFIGASGRNPTETELAAIFGSGYDPNLTSGSDENHSDHDHDNNSSAAFELDPDNASVVGLKGDRSTRGIYVGYEPNSQTWEVRLSSPTREVVRVAVESDRAISNFTEINFTSADPDSLALADRFLVYNPNSGSYQNRTNSAGLGDPTLAHSAVAADFDNDMDLDIYLANAYPSFNQPNILYKNDGNGNFTKVALGGGATGSEVGFHRLDFEIGQRLATADYDNDGFVDIFAGSTTAKSPRKTYLGTPSQLFHNEEGINGNNNNWLQIDLQGIQSNRDAIGARVLLTTPDGVTQVREQNGGTHVFAQNSTRLHFGLGQNNTISNLEVQWSSGETTTLANINVNQILNLVEAFPSIITGDDNNNVINGTIKPDQIIGLAGDDTLNGGNNNDRLEAGTGNDSLTGGNGHDTLIGDTGHDTLNGGMGNDLLNGDGCKDLLKGNEGTDTLYGGDDNDTLNGGADSDRLFGESGDDSLYGSSGDDILEGNTGADTLYGETGNDTLTGGDDNDLLVGGNDNDLLDGENGNDTLLGNRGKDILLGNAGNDVLNGNGGNDTLIGGADDDSLIGEGGADVLEGGDGLDTLRGSNGNDTLDGGNGSDRLIEFNNSNFFLTNTQLIARGTDTISNFESARLVGGSGNNLMEASTVTTINVLLEGATGNDTLIGGSRDDTLKGLNDNDFLKGQAGDDKLYGGNGNDTITGGEGNDTLFGNNGNDLLFESANSDFILQNNRLTTVGGTDQLGGIEGVHLVAGTNDNLLDAAAVSQMTVILEGGNGNDTLFGGTKDDLLTGGNGADLLTGGAGSDRFIFDSLTEIGDTITDFNPNSDLISISASSFGSDLTANQFLNSTRFVIGTTATDSDHRFIYNNSNGNLFFDPDGNGNSSPLAIATLNGTPTISHQDIFVTA